MCRWFQLWLPLKVCPSDTQQPHSTEWGLEMDSNSIIQDRAARSGKGNDDDVGVPDLSTQWERITELSTSNHQLWILALKLKLSERLAVFDTDQTERCPSTYVRSQLAMQLKNPVVILKATP